MRNTRAKRVGFLAMVIVCVLGVGAPAMATPEEAFQALGQWQMSQARTMIDGLSAREKASADGLYLEGRYRFYMGEYGEAVRLLDEALEEQEVGEWRRLRDLAERTRGVTEGYKKFVSESGRFEMYVEPGKDEILVPYAFEALESAYEILGEELDYWPTEPVRVEVYPRALVLAEVSLLTEENIRTSGTIALCQYNRLMISSPRSVLRGYPWVDTLIHEYVHYVVNQATTHNVPIWMHEGLAKYLEREWRGQHASRLEVAVEHLLRRRMEEDDLVTFDEMHPSMAMLPSQEDAAVAFAEVYTTMEYLRQEGGLGVFGRLLREINAGHEAREAFAGVLGVRWEEFEGEIWPAYLAERPEPPYSGAEGVAPEEIVLRGDANEAQNELEQIRVPGARDHMQLGQMLQARSRYRAAVVQYEKAGQILGELNPVLQNRLAQSLVRSGEPGRAIEALRAVRELYPSQVSTWISLGRAYVEGEEYGAAMDALREAARINPFHPEVHELMERAARRLGDEEGAQRSREAMTLLQGS